MNCEVEVTDEFIAWWKLLTEYQQDEIAAVVGMLEEHGAGLGYPRSSDVRSSRHGQMRELRIQIDGSPYRVLYAFDPRRVAILLTGGRKSGGDRWYERNIAVADRLFSAHLSELKKSSGEK